MFAQSNMGNVMILSKIFEQWSTNPVKKKTMLQILKYFEGCQFFRLIANIRSHNSKFS